MQGVVGSNFGNYPPLPAPTGAGPDGVHVPAGRLDVIEDGDDLIAVTVCDEDQGFVSLEKNIEQLR